jgi:Ricin-type beta-trefoil lectin domain
MTGTDRWARDTGSLAVAMLLTLVGASLSALLVPVVLVQLSSTRTDTARVHALNAAQAGLDVAIGHLRAANDGAGHGVLASLPCGPLTGSVSAAASARYQVTIDYFSTDPQGQSSSWIATNRIPCITGGGTYRAPNYALLHSLGSDLATGTLGSVPGRSLQATYTFTTTNQNIAGGLIHVYKTTSTDLCLDAGSGSPAPGAPLLMAVCTPGSVQQRFEYDANLNLVLVASRTDTRPLGLCLDSDTPHAAGNPVYLQPCGTVTQPDQQWSTNDSANFEGTADGSTLDHYCFNVQNPNTPGSRVVLSYTNCRKSYDNIETFIPEASVGAGAAGPASHQLVNFSEFGRCLDVTEQNIGSLYMIAWPCKQAPDPANVAWNQKWTLPAIAAGTTSATGRIITTPSSGYCLQSPRSTAAGQYVTVTPCPSGSTPANLTWTVYGDTKVYQTSYRILDVDGNCLAPTDPTANPPDFYPKGLAISKMAIATCGGSALQKWNAPPNIQQVLPLKDISEN